VVVVMVVVEEEEKKEAEAEEEVEVVGVEVVGVVVEEFNHKIERDDVVWSAEDREIKGTNRRGGAEGTRALEHD